MVGKIRRIAREINGIAIEQRERDGFVNGTAMCVAHGKLIADWFRNQETVELLTALAVDLDLEINYGISHNSGISSISAAYPDLVLSRRGSPENGGGTWVHPDLAVQLAQWCSPGFAIIVSRWVRTWMLTMFSPTQIEADIDRVSIRDDIKGVKRTELTDQVKVFLEAVGRYDPSSRETRSVFARVHDKLNLILTGETARSMRNRLEVQLGRKVSESELLRDYFPIEDLVNYGTLCQAAANEMKANGTDPITAIEIAARQVLPVSYEPKQIVFTERIALVRERINQRDQLKFRGVA